MHLHLRLLAVLAALALGVLISGWGIAASVRPGLWGRRGVRWCVGWTPGPVGRMFGIAVATFGAGIVVSGVAGALAPPAVGIPPLARGVELTGLALLVLSGAALLATHPAPFDEIDDGGPLEADRRGPGTAATTDASPVDPAPGRDAATR